MTPPWLQRALQKRGLLVFDPGHNYDDKSDGDDETPMCMGMTSLSVIQRHALFLFGETLKRNSPIPIPDGIPAGAEKYLPIEEVEAIVRERTSSFHKGFMLGGDTEEAVVDTVRELFVALSERIMSNILASGVQKGLLDCSFNADRNDFEFSMTPEGEKVSDQYKNDNSSD